MLVQISNFTWVQADEIIHLAITSTRPEKFGFMGRITELFRSKAEKNEQPPYQLTVVCKRYTHTVPCDTIDAADKISDYIVNQMNGVDEPAE